MKLLTQWAFTSSALILIELAVRGLFRDKLSARLRYALWGVVLLRLLIPFQVELPAPVSDSLPVLATNLAPELPSVLDRPLSPATAATFTQIPAEHLEDNKPNGEPVFSFTAADLQVYDPENDCLLVYRDGFTLGDMAVALWLTGAGLMGAVILLSNLGFALRMRKRRRGLEVPDAPIPVYTAEGLPSPCLFGVFRPAVYVTPQAAEDPDTLRHVLAHELTHYAHKDHLWSLLRCLALALHWYNPLVWLAVVLSKQDGELACDEGAVARLGEAERIPYGRTLVDMVAARSLRPGDLLSCSTAMTGRGKSVKRRVAQIVKKPETVKAALFAVIALVALSAVFAFAGRVHVTTYEELCRMTQDDLIVRVRTGSGDSSVSFHMGTNPNLQSILQSGTAKGGTCSAPELVPDALELIFPVYDRDGTYQTYHLVETGRGCELVTSRFGERDTIYYNQRIAVFPDGTSEKIKALAQEQGTNASPLPSGERFLADLESASSIRYIPTILSSRSYPVPITDEELLAQAKERLSTFTYLSEDEPYPDLSGLAPYQNPKIVLTCGEQEAVYTLMWQNNYTYLFPGDLWEQQEELMKEEGETAQLQGVSGTMRSRPGDRVFSAVSELALCQLECSQDPSLPRRMTQEELSQYTPQFLLAHGVQQLQGRPDGMESAVFHVGITSPDSIQLWYQGDETHGGVWVLELSQNSYTVLSDQPVEIYNAAHHISEEESYEQLGPGAFIASLRTEDVIGVYLSQYSVPLPSDGTELQIDIETIKEQAVQGLFHQCSAKYTEEKHGQYSLTILVEKDVDYYLHDGGADGLTLSIGTEPDVVCMRHRIMASPQREMGQYIYSPELYRTIRDLFD